MMKLLNLEYQKMVNYRPFLVLFFTYFVILITIGAFSSYIEIGVQGQKIDLKQLGAYNFPAIWQFSAWFALMLKLFLGILVIFNITNEYNYKTIKQNLIDGLSKGEFFASKLIGALLFAALSTLVFGVIVFGLGAAFSTSDAAFHHGIEFLGYYFLNLLVFFSILIFLSFLTKKTIFALLLTVVWWIVEATLGSVEAVVRLMPSIKEGNVNSEEAEGIFLISNYLPMNCLGNLVEFPNANLMNFLNGDPVFSINPTNISYAIVAVSYFVLFNFLSFYLLRKRDL